ncbi:MAG: hypothetical protein HC910_00260 [Spirulinaceae cyanobacterium SM2_1_0]|nr:hypothetical protein [Spirulinaceae cyanobacterium SM2_1_0]
MQKYWMDSPTIFSLLQEFLGTKTGFSEQYKVTATTGMRGIGDSSEQIKAGHLVRQTRPLDRAREISPDLVAAAEQSYQNCRQALQARCYSLASLGLSC